MSEMVTKVAHALQSADFTTCGIGDWDEEAMRLYWLEVARVAIRAMREPTEGMVQSAISATSAYLDIEGSALTVNRTKMRIRWQAMIDRALK